MTVSLITGNVTDYSNFDPDRLAEFKRPAHWRRQHRDGRDPADKAARTRPDRRKDPVNPDAGIISFDKKDGFKVSTPLCSSS